MIEIVSGNIFNSSCQALTNPVNTVGVMGAGLALQFKNRYPQMFQHYQTACRQKKFVIGQPSLYTANTPWILNFPTKVHYKDPSIYPYIENGLIYLRQHYQEWELKSLALPPIGCGLGGLQWDHVRELIFKYLSLPDLDLEIYVQTF